MATLVQDQAINIAARPGIATPIELAQTFVHTSVQAPALASALSEKTKDKVRHSDMWLASFKRVGDLLAYLKRFDVAHNDPVYKEMKQHELLTFEDIVAEFELKFGRWANDCSRISDFVIGGQYSASDILILAQNYDFRSGGMFVLEADARPVAVIIKATLLDGPYKNEWLQEQTVLKYYLKSISGNFGEYFKPNKAIIDNPNVPIVAFVREAKRKPFIFHGIFRYQSILHEDEGKKAFVLTKHNGDNFNIMVESSYVAESLAESVAESISSARAQRLQRLAKAPRVPVAFQVVSTAYNRNADVVAEVLFRAEGVCEGCNLPAPFLRRRDSTPYLEVHHLIPLAMRGEDTVENALALCPNCHRQRHFGPQDVGIDEFDALIGEDVANRRRVIGDPTIIINETI
jgi:5-methylcytosine-specific restriction protein A